MKAALIVLTVILAGCMKAREEQGPFLVEASHAGGWGTSRQYHRFPSMDACYEALARAQAFRSHHNDEESTVTWMCVPSRVVVD